MATVPKIGKENKVHIEKNLKLSTLSISAVYYQSQWLSQRFCISKSLEVCGNIDKEAEQQTFFEASQGHQ